jgi:Flp pilus assembly protein TadB
MGTIAELDRTLELPPEPLDDLEDLGSTTTGPIVPRQERIQTISRPLPLEDLDRKAVEATLDDEGERMLARELATRRLAYQRREQKHRHAIEEAEQKHRHEQLLLRNGQEARIVLSMLALVVLSGLAWITMPTVDAAQIVFTTSFGAVAGFLGARSRRNDAPA